MAMTLRMSEDDEQALERLAASQHVSKHQAALLAIHATDRRQSRLSEVEGIADRMLKDWGPVFDALART